MLVNTNHSRAKYFSKVHTRHLMAFNNRPCRDVPCSVSMQYKIPPKVLEIKYSQSQLFSLHFSIIRNNFAIKVFKGVLILFEIVFISIKTLNIAFKVRRNAFKVRRNAFKVRRNAFKVRRNAFKVRRNAFKLV